MLDQSRQTLEDIAIDSRIPVAKSMAWRGIIKRLIVLRQRLGLGWVVKDSRERTRKLAERLSMRVTPPEERIIVGRCLNPACICELSIVGRREQVTCQSCGSVWEVRAVTNARAERLRRDTRLMERAQTPEQAARWIWEHTHVRVTRQAVSMRISRGMMPLAVAVEDGTYRFSRAELMELAVSSMTHR
jgi:hypothetical protein